MPLILRKGSHWTFVMRKWSFQHILIHCINLELKVCFLFSCIWLMLNYHVLTSIYIFSWSYRTINKWADTLHLCFLEVFVFLCFICIKINANKFLPGPLSQWMGNPSHLRHLRTKYISQCFCIQVSNQMSTFLE